MPKRVVSWIRPALALACALAAASCADVSAAPGSKTAAEVPRATASVVLDAQGLHPSTLTLPAGETVAFTNDDVDPHQFMPAPTTADGVTTGCPEVSTAVVQPGESVSVAIGVHDQPCAYLDGLDPSAARFHGTVMTRSSVHRQDGQTTPGPTRGTSFP